MARYHGIIYKLMLAPEKCLNSYKYCCGIIQVLLLLLLLFQQEPSIFTPEMHAKSDCTCAEKLKVLY